MDLFVFYVSHRYISVFIHTHTLTQTNTCSVSGLSAIVTTLQTFTRTPMLNPLFATLFFFFQIFFCFHSWYLHSRSFVWQRTSKKRKTTVHKIATNVYYNFSLYFCFFFFLFFPLLYSVQHTILCTHRLKRETEKVEENSKVNKYWFKNIFHFVVAPVAHSISLYLSLFHSTHSYCFPFSAWIQHRQHVSIKHSS